MPERTAGEMLTYMGTDAAKWAAEFVHLRKTRDMDEGAMISWFANAIEAGRSAGMKATCPHGDVCDLSAGVSYCRTCGTVFDA
jgi:hypothetical protein